MNQGNADVDFSERGLSDVCTYLALCHNHFAKVHGTNFSPLEYATHRSLTKPPSALFGQSCIAELPASMRAQSPNETRNVEAAFVHHGLDTGPVVQGAVRIDGELVLKRFVARNLRPIIRWLEPDNWRSTFHWNGRWNSRCWCWWCPDGGSRSCSRCATWSSCTSSTTSAPSTSESQQPGGIVEYPEGAPSEVIRDLKQPDPDAGRNLKRSAPSSGSGRKPGELKIARPTEVRASDIPIPPPGSFPNRPPLIVQKKFSVSQRHLNVLHVNLAWKLQELGTMLNVRESV